MARSIRASGGRPGDIVHVAYGYGLFTGGLGAHYGAEKLGCTVIPMSGGQTEKQITLINDGNAPVELTGPPSVEAPAEAGFSLEPFEDVFPLEGAAIGELVVRFAPSAEAYAPSVAAMESFTARMTRHGVSTQDDIDLFIAIEAGEFAAC
mgnify:CR=1 FL=1